MPTTPTAKILTPISFCFNFPDGRKNEIVREHVLANIIKQFDNGKSMITIDGEEGIGKTTILKQFCERYAPISFCSFINPVQGKLPVEDKVLNDFYTQIYWFVNREELPADFNIDSEKYNTLLFQLMREQKKRKTAVYFVLDGLEYIHDQTMLRKIYELLPVQEPGMRILLSVDLQKIKQFIHINNEQYCTSIPLLTFSVQETKQLYEDWTEITDEQLHRLWLAGNQGLPGKLCDIQRHIIDHNLSIESFLENYEEGEEIHDMDWAKLKNAANDVLNKIVIFAALDDRVYTIDMLAKLLEVTEEEIRAAISRVSFLLVNSNNEVSFTSNSSRMFFGKKLSENKKYVLTENIKFFLKNKHDVDSLIRLPKYLSSNSEYETVIDLLSESYFPKVVRESQSMTSVTGAIDLGFQAAKKVGNDQKLLSFSLYGSLAKNVEGLHVWDSEIEARIELGDYENAIRLANSALLKEDRLKLLVRIAKIKKKKKESIEDTLLDQITLLYKAVDFKNLGLKSIDIAADLFYSIPSLALNLIQNTSSKKDETLNDWVLTKIAISAFDSDQGSDSKKVTSLIRNDKVREIANSLSSLFADYGAEDILREANQVDGPKEKLLLLKIWVTNNKEDKNVGKVILAALEHFISMSSKEFGGANTISELVEPVEFISDKVLIGEIIEKALQFRNEVKKLGSSLEFVKFLSNCIKGKIKVDYAYAIQLFNEAKQFADSCEDIVTRTECLAYLDKCLFEVRAYLHKQQVYLAETLKSQVKGLVIDICKSTAYHYENLKEIISLVASHDYKLAIEFASKANTITSRDKLTFTCFSSYVLNNIDSLSEQSIGELLSKIKSNDLYELSLKVLLDEIASKSSSKPNSKVTNLLLREISNVKSFTSKCYFISLLVIILTRDEAKNKALISKLENELETFWRKIDSDINKIEIGFQIASLVATVNLTMAKRFLNEAELLKKNVWADSLNTVSIYTTYAHLLLLAFSGLIKLRAYTDDHFEKLEEILGHIPSPVIRIHLWSYLAFVAHIKNDINLREKVVVTYVKPGLESINDESVRQDIFVEIVFLLFANNQLSTLNAIEGLDDRRKEYAITSILDQFFYSEIPGEEYEDTEAIKDRITHDELLVVCDLIKKLEVDYNIYNYCELVVKAALNIKVISALQKENLKSLLSEIIKSKLPNKNYIQHPGYKLVSLANLLKLEKDAKNQETDLLQLMGQIEAEVSNASDKAFIYVILSEIVPTLKVRSISQNDLINKALSIIEKLNYGLEFVYRIDFMSRTSHKLNPKLWKEKLKAAFGKTVTNYFRSDSVGIQKKLIDKAFKHDPDFAKSLVSLLDDDESRIEYRKKKHLQDYFESLHLKKQMMEDKVDSEKKSAHSFANACAKSISSLNSSTIVPKKTNQIRYLLDHSIKLPIKESHYIYSYYIKNLVKRQEDSVDIKNVINPIFQNIYTLCKVIEILVERYKSNVSDTIESISLDRRTKKRFKAGERDLVFKYIRDWLVQNASKYIKISDPNFNKGDLSILKLILEASPEATVTILTTHSAQEASLTGNEPYLEHWKTISEQDPPNTKIAFVKFRNSTRIPFEEKCIFLDGTGIEFNTSIANLGIVENCEISEMDENKKISLEQQLFDNLFEGKRMDGTSERIDCISFNLN